ncbi:MAG: response regulator [Marinifilaceae bacterium]|jgi:CheY-like chemotaxis protein|nr:response regulator [Marinifilaceae bacterium]
MEISNINWGEKKILIAEDAEDNFFLLSAILKKTKISIVRATNGQEAVDLCKENDDIQAVLMDISMPVMDGLEATKLIKEFRPDLPIIIQTAYAMESDKETSFSAGCDDYISKPIRRNFLMELLSKYLDK